MIRDELNTRLADRLEEIGFLEVRDVYLLPGRQDTPEGGVLTGSTLDDATIVLELF